MRCGEPSPETGKMKGALDLGRLIIESIDALRASSQPNVMLIYIPRRWEQWNGYRTETERFDLHRFVKAYCVQRGITTQFLREETLSKPYQCEVMWWLSLSFYVKAMRIPWLLDGLDKDTAFVGLGFSVDPGGKDRPIVLGCSHIYGADGLGLQYKLSKIEEPVWRQKNPYMSRDDARRLGEAIRQLFYESRARLPSRVVIHKRTPFLMSERDGLREGLGGIDSIEMLEVTVDPALRYVASRLSGGRLVEDGYPVQRGTTVVLDDSRVLLWVHGSTSSLQPGRRYYQGKSRIPAPLAIIRHAGTSPLSMVATEILGLSKMNWNSFDMYAKLPATIQSSSEIADVGGLLERFGPASYDYRLFI
jgi:hypothetical protein